MRETWSKIRALLVQRGKQINDLDEEINAHLEFEIEDNRARGMAPDKAAQTAQRVFGNVTLIKEDARNAWLFPALENFLGDTMYAIRTMRKAPVFAIAAIVTLALGIGANTAIFTVIRGVLLKPLAYRQSDRLVRISIDNSRENYHDAGFTLVRYREMKSVARSFRDLGAFFIATEHLTLSGAAEPEQVTAARISANLLDILGVKPLLGRSFRPEEDTPGGTPVALISAPLWNRRFGRDPMITRRTINLNAMSYTVVGVLPGGFEFPSAGIDVWVSKPAEFSQMPARFWSRLTVLIGLGRLQPHVTLEQARAELRALNRQYVKAHPDMADAEPGVSIRAVLLRDQMVENVRPMLWILFGAVALVLIIACANVASLLLARAASRSREFAVRPALGAGRGRLIRQLLAESVLLAVIGGSLGVLLAKWSLKALTGIGAFHLPRADEIHLDATVLAFTVALSVATGVFFGLFPSFQVSLPTLSNLLRDRANISHVPANRGNFGIDVRRLLVTGQVAFSVMLLIGAALLMESFIRLRAVNPGFNSAHLLTMRIDLPPARYNTPQKKDAFFNELLRRVKSLPGVSRPAAALTLPLSPIYATSIQIVEQPSLQPNEHPSVQLQSVTPGYFRTAGIALLRGREFTDPDNKDGAPLRVMINESLARRFWKEYPRGRDPVGQHLIVGTGSSSLWEIIGIAADVHERGFATAANPELYLPTHSYPLQTAGVLVRTQGDPLRLINAIRREVLAIDPDQPIAAVQTMNQLLDSSIGQQRLTLILLGSFAAVALLLAAIGIYGLIAYSVVQRIPELGIRRALGAQSGNIRRLVIGQSLGLTLAGLALGLIGAFGLTRMMSSLLFHVSATDPAAFAGVALVFLAVAVAASCIPALRATRVDPITALR